MRRISRSGIVLTALLLAVSGDARVKVVELKSGERVVGALLSEPGAETVVVKSDLLGKVSIPEARVNSIHDLSSPASKPNLAPVSASVPPAKPSSNTAPSTVAATTPQENAEQSVAPTKDSSVLDRIRDFEAPRSWSGNFRFGLNESVGDKKWSETYLRGRVEIDPEEDPNFLRVNGSYIYRLNERSDGSKNKTNDKYDGTVTYRRTFARDWFLQNATGGRADQLKGINRELQNLLGIGYRIRPSSKFDFLFGVGGGVEYFDADFEDEATTDGVANFFQEFTYRPWNRTSFVQEFSYFVNPDAEDEYNYVFKAAIRLRLTDLLGFEFSYNKDFDNNVRPGDVEDDTHWRNALVLYF